MHNHDMIGTYGNPRHRSYQSYALLHNMSPIDRERRAGMMAQGSVHQRWDAMHAEVGPVGHPAHHP